MRRGRSPRVRGSRAAGDDEEERPGSIPACAGEPDELYIEIVPYEVDPRVCGGAKLLNGLALREYGRSPRVRGSRCACRRTPGCGGSIPACAGEPLARRDQGAQPGVDPRVCGGAVLPVEQHGFGEGRSPRVRGSRREGGDGQLDRRSIPACAGEPVPRRAAPCATGVDPRVCGGAGSKAKREVSEAGRSPRVRGEPRGRSPGARIAGVDPRVCGGALSRLCARIRLPGRSPRVRGSHEERHQRGAGKGSIPACAGEPRGYWCSRTSKRVDPRVCGGALSGPYAEADAAGRSPRVRGSPAMRRERAMRTGSIPACAGEPATQFISRKCPKVDPRVCGGAPKIVSASRAASGRSPRVRGSHRKSRSQSKAPGSIPACAGEPALLPRWKVAARVDPRVCGGASAFRPRVQPRQGRSPRVRGSRHQLVELVALAGSIPACAGEPLYHRVPTPDEKVDPRVCGGAVDDDGFPGPVLRRSPRVRGSLCPCQG